MERKQPSTRRSFLKGALAATAASPMLFVEPSSSAEAKRPALRIGPSTTAEPYLRPTIAGAKTVSILTTGDSVGGYRMVGIPDGLGAFQSGHKEFTLLVNHELSLAPPSGPGIVRAHGSNGAFVSRWTIDTETLKVKKGQDHTPSADHVFLWDPVAKQYKPGTRPWQRLCSADLPAPSAFFAHGLGTQDRIFMDGEEITEGQAWARIASGPHVGEAWQLPRLGRIAFENAVACPHPQAKTIVVATDDSALSTAGGPTDFPSEVYFYIGTKQTSGHPIERAGLTNGWLYGLTVSVNGQPVLEESELFGLGSAGTGYVGKGRFGLANLQDVSGLSARQLEDASIAAGVARLQRCEDSCWDPREGRRNNLYFVTTGSATTNSRLWHLRFDDIEHPEMGGTIEILLRGDEGHRMLDNVTIDHLGRIVMDEDPGGNNRIAKIWLYSIETREFLQVAAHNPKFFDPDSKKPEFLTNDEESSGIIDAAHLLGEGWFLLDVQSHKVSSDPELVEGGQLLALWIDPDVGLNSNHKGNRHDDNEGRR